MTIVEPIPDLQWGKGTWQDYISNWRTRDTNWVQERLILRYQTTAARTADWPSPRAGQVTFNNETNLLEMWHPVKAAWVRSLMFQYLLSNKDDAAGVSLFHASSGAKGVTLTPTSLVIDAPTTTFLAGVHTVDASGMTLKTGAKTAKLTTDATALVSDSPIKAPSVDLTAGISAASVSTPSLSAANATVTTGLTLTGATVTGGILNSTSAAINGVQIGNTAAHGAGGVRADAQGFHAQNGAFYGDGSSAIVRQRNPATGAYGTAYLQMGSGQANMVGDLWMMSYLRIMGGRGVPWHNAAGTHTAWIAPVIYSGSDPGAANYPDGTLWLS